MVSGGLVWKEKQPSFSTGFCYYLALIYNLKEGSRGGLHRLITKGPQFRQAPTFGMDFLDLFMTYVLY